MISESENFPYNSWEVTFTKKQADHIIIFLFTLEK